MRFLLSFLVLFSGTAFADLYRWVDPETGSVKFSSYPPPWFGDAEEEKRAPKVEHIPERKRGAAAAAEGETPTGPLGSLEERRRRIMQQIATLPAQDLQRGGAGLKEQLEAYAAVTTEMDRLDPKGADRRRAEAQPLLQKLVEGVRSQLKSPASAAK